MLREYAKRGLIIGAILALVFMMVGCQVEKSRSAPMQAVVKERHCTDWNGCWTYVQAENNAMYKAQTMSGAIGDTITIVVVEYSHGMLRWKSPLPQDK